MVAKVDDIATEVGLAARFARHVRLNRAVHDWGYRMASLFPAETHASVTLNCFANTRGTDLPALNAALQSRGFVIDGGYGKLKGKTFRISNMGDETDATIAELLEALDASLRDFFVESPS